MPCGDNLPGLNFVFLASVFMQILTDYSKSNAGRAINWSGIEYFRDTLVWDHHGGVPIGAGLGGEVHEVGTFGIGVGKIENGEHP